MNIVIPVYITEFSNKFLICDQLYVTMESYYYHGNSGTFIIFTNDDDIEISIKNYKNVFSRDIVIIRIDFEKAWNQINLPISESKTRRNFIISKLIIPFIFDDEYLLMDWDILTTGKINEEFIRSDKLRFFNAKFYDGLTLRQNSIMMGFKPENDYIGNFRWVNSGMFYSPKGLCKNLVEEYWNKFNDLDVQEYKGIYLFDIIDDELIYNLMLLDRIPQIEECRRYNLNVVPRNFYYTFSNIKSMYGFGDKHPHILNIHFVGGHIKPFDVVVDENNNLSYNIKVESYSTDKNIIRWLFDMNNHRAGSYNYNALIFSLIWQYTRYTIRENLALEPDKKMSQRYLDFFNRSIVG